MLDFNTNIQDVIATQKTTTRTHAFVEYNSKKKLFESGRLTEAQQTFINQLKGTFTFNIHESNRYLVVTMYYSRDKKYGFIIVDLETFKCAQSDSVKNAKKGVLELIAAQPTVEASETEKAEEEVPTETAEEPQAAEENQENAEEEPKTRKNSRKNGKK